MRTTLSLDDDVVLAVQERARRERRSLGGVLSDLARQALTGQYAAADIVGEEEGATSFYGFLPFPHRRKLVSNALIDQLRDEAV